MMSFKMIGLTVLALGFSGMASAADSPWASGGEFSLGYDSNINNAPVGQSERGSGVADGLLYAGHTLTSDGVSLLTRGSLRMQTYEHAPSLSNIKAGALARVLMRTGRGLLAPTLSASVSANYWEFNSRQRDSVEYRAGLALQQQVTTQITARLLLESTRRDSQSRVFDLRGRSAGVGIDWQPRPRLNVHLGYQFSDGDVVATSSPGPVIASVAEVIEPDQAFGGDVARQRAYRFDADTQIATLGFNYAFSNALSLDTQVQYVDTNSRPGSIQYTRWISGAGLLWRFGR